MGPVTFQTIQITEVGTAALPVKLCLLCQGGGSLGPGRRGLQVSEFWADLINFSGPPMLRHMHILLWLCRF